MATFRLLALLILVFALPVKAQTWEHVAAEGAAASVPYGSTVRYGADTRWTTRTLSKAFTCNTSTFGSDPAVGTVKACQVRRGWACWPDGTLRMAQTSYGREWTWWCKAPADQHGVEYFLRQPFTVPDKHVDLGAWAAASARVAVAGDRLAQAIAEIDLVSKPPPAEGSVEAFDLATLRRAACVRAHEPPYPPGAQWAAVDMAVACGPVPVPPAAPPPPAGIYVVTGSTAYPLKPDGTRSLTAWPTKPTLGETCDCSVQVISYGARFCKVPRLSTSQTVVAGCSLKK